MVLIKHIDKHNINIYMRTRYEAGHPPHVHVEIGGKKGKNKKGRKKTARVFMNCHWDQEKGTFKEDDKKVINQYVVRNRDKLTRMFNNMVKKGTPPHKLD